MKKRAKKKTAPREAPQRLVRRSVVCDRCGGVDSFRAVGRYRNVRYLICSACGRRATQLVLAPGGAGAENREQQTTER